MTTETDGIVWRPTPEVAQRARIGRFMRTHGIATLAELQRRSVAGLVWYWECGGARSAGAVDHAVHARAG